VTPTETAALLALCSRYDLRTVGDEDVEAWYAILADVHPQDAIAAARRWYSEPRKNRAMPGDIRGLARAIHLEHLGALDEAAVPDADPDDVPGYIVALRERRLRQLDQLRDRDVGPLLRVFRQVAR
jgi:hypothetical protein